MALLSQGRTILVQTALSVVLMTAGVVLAYEWALVPNYTGVLGALVFVAVLLAALFPAASAAGALLFGINVLFYRIQVARHGTPSENVTDN